MGKKHLPNNTAFTQAVTPEDAAKLVAMIVGFANGGKIDTAEATRSSITRGAKLVQAAFDSPVGSDERAKRIVEIDAAAKTYPAFKSADVQKYVAGIITALKGGGDA